MPRKKFGRNRKNRCRFCTPEGCPRPAYVDYKDIGLLLVKHGRVGLSGLRRLQGCRPAQEAVHQPEQDVLSQAQRQLCGVSASLQRGCEACAFHGSPAVRRRVTRLARLLSDYGLPVQRSRGTVSQ